MKDYLQFVWDSLVDPHSIMDVLPAAQLVLALICWYYAVRAIISIYQYNKHIKNGKK